VLIDESAVDKRLFDVLAVQLRFLQDVVGLRRLEKPLLDEKIEDLLRVHRFVLGSAGCQPARLGSLPRRIA